MDGVQETYAVGRSGELIRVTPLMLPAGAMVIGLVEVEGERYEVRKVSWEATAASADLIQRVDRILFWSFRETTTTAVARLRLRDGSDANGDTIVPISLSADQSTRDWLGPQGIPCKAGVYLEMITGTVEGSIVVAVRKEPEEQ